MSGTTIRKFMLAYLLALLKARRVDAYIFNPLLLCDPRLFESSSPFAVSSASAFLPFKSTVVKLVLFYFKVYK